jgi:MFS family permease
MMPLGGWLADRRVSRHGIRLGLRWVAVGSLLLSVLGLVAALNVVETSSLVALLSLSFGFAAIADVVFWAAVISIGGSHGGTAAGVMNTGGNFGGAVAPFVTPLIASRYGWTVALYVGAIVAFLGVIAWLRIDASPISEIRPRRAGVG